MHLTGCYDESENREGGNTSGRSEIMIIVSVNEKEISMSGHAGYADRGSDIVCAGATALVQTLIGSFDITGDTPGMEILPGHFRINTEELTENGKLLIKFFMKGLESIEEEFPGNLRIYTT